MGFERKSRKGNIELVAAKKALMKKKRAQICLWVDAEQYKKLKIRAVMEEKTVTDIISTSINLYLQKQGKYDEKEKGT